jgi:hypothetical protein
MPSVSPRRYAWNTAAYIADKEEEAITEEREREREGGKRMEKKCTL